MAGAATPSGTVRPHGGAVRGLLVGYGSIGRRHLQNLHALGVDDWAVVHTGSGTLPLEPPCPVRTYGDLQEALDAEAPAFAVVANPTNLHVPTAVACLHAGASVLLEKPVAAALAEVGVLERAAADGPGRVLVGFQFRFHSALRRIGELLGAGAVGAPLSARVIWAEHLPSWHPWEDYRRSYAARADLGGGVHHTISHPLDYLLMLFGEPISVMATLREDGPLGLGVPEAADVVARFAGGVAAQVHLDYWTRPTAHRVELSCTEGSIEWNYIAGTFRVWDAGTEAWHDEVHPGLECRNELFVAEARHFLDVVDGAAPFCTLRDGVNVVRLCAAIEASARSA